MFSRISNVLIGKTLQLLPAFGREVAVLQESFFGPQRQPGFFVLGAHKVVVPGNEFVNGKFFHGVK